MAVWKPVFLVEGFPYGAKQAAMCITHNATMQDGVRKKISS